MTAAEVLHLHDKGLTAAQISRRLNLTQHRVESILDREAEAAGPLVEYLQAPGIEPLRGDVQTQPDKVKGKGGKRFRASDYYTHGTPYGYTAHKRDHEKPCEPCHEAARQQWAVNRAKRKAMAS